MRFRNAVLTDWARLYALRIDETVAENSIQPPPSFDQHWAWMRDMLAGLNQVRVGYLSDEDDFLGVSRLARKDGYVWASIALIPSARGHGWSINFILECELMAWQAGHRHVRAEVKVGNLPSLKAFASAGYVPIRCFNDAVVILGKDLHETV